MQATEVTALREPERRAVERAIAAIRASFSERLLAVWLFGSRARQERPGEESDVDLLVLVDRKLPGDDREAARIGIEEGTAEGLSSMLLDIRVQDRAWLEDRRRIDSFFTRALDRDKVVLVGSEL